MNKDTPFAWDERAHESFDALKKLLVVTLMLSPPNYSLKFLLYVVMSWETIVMVLVQEDEDLQEHVICYLSRNLIDVEIHYSHVEKLVLATVHAVQ